MQVVEVGIKLEEDLSYYDKILRNSGLKNEFSCETHDIYYTNKNLDNLSENEIKNSCIRIRSVNESDYKVQNNMIADLDIEFVSANDLALFDEKMSIYNYKRVFNTRKLDHHYYKDGMKSKIQLQEIDDIGLVLYYDNPSYYEYDLDTQRKMLIMELNSYGLDIDENTPDIDKLRTLYYNKGMPKSI